MAIEETVSAAEANLGFSWLLRGVREGRSYVVTAHGRSIAPLGAYRRGGLSGRVREPANGNCFAGRRANRLSISAGGRGTSFTIGEGRAR